MSDPRGRSSLLGKNLVVLPCIHSVCDENGAWDLRWVLNLATILGKPDPSRRILVFAPAVDVSVLCSDSFTQVWGACAQENRRSYRITLRTGLELAERPETHVFGPKRKQYVDLTIFTEKCFGPRGNSDELMALCGLVRVGGQHLGLSTELHHNYLASIWGTCEVSVLFPAGPKFAKSDYVVEHKVPAE